ncbi:DUF3833 family protein [Alteromonas lipotrueiana]|uniref:DUF3833 family protein n=1 Tax=Alteromonas lipotrueiana TaxID=2803815 RepID=UPI001C48DF0C|nr:DUF3833 family protein [Alteromonas lipotrueiana]
MKKTFQALSFAGSLVLLAGCAGAPEGQTYQQIQPKLNIEQFFNGNVKAWGIAQNWSGEVVQRFKVDINGRIEGDTLIMDETFDYGVGDGPKQRTWKITSDGTDSFIGRAADIDGPAQGTSYGNAFNFTYEMDLPVDDTTYHVNFDDWFFAFDDSTLMNKSYIKKYGVVVAEVTIFMQKQ